MNQRTPLHCTVRQSVEKQTRAERTQKHTHWADRKLRHVGIYNFLGSEKKLDTT